MIIEILLSIGHWHEEFFSKTYLTDFPDGLYVNDGGILVIRRWEQVLRQFLLKPVMHSANKQMRTHL